MKGQPTDALGFASRLTKIQPNVGATWALVGLCEFQAGDYENALVHLRRGQDLGFPPGSGGAISEANYHIGILLNLKGDFGAAHDMLVQEVKGGTERSDDAKYALGINLLRLRLLPSQVEKADQPMVQTAGSIAMDLTKSDYGPATEKFDELLLKYPGRGYVHDAYGWTLMSISRYDAAAEQYRKETQLSPKSSEAYLGLATAALKTHNFEEARDAAKKATELSPDSAMAHGQYGRALMELSDLKGGIVELEKAVQLAVAIPELHFSLSRAYAKANRPKDAERERQIFLRLNQQQNNK
jgi:tetratricopeptide (TPR) repeat protein